MIYGTVRLSALELRQVAMVSRLQWLPANLAFLSLCKYVNPALKARLLRHNCLSAQWCHTHLINYTWQQVLCCGGGGPLVTLLCLMSSLNILDAFQTVYLLDYEVKNIRDKFTTNFLAYVNSLLRPMYVISDHSYRCRHSIAHIIIIVYYAEVARKRTQNSATYGRKTIK